LALTLALLFRVVITGLTKDWIEEFLADLMAVHFLKSG
jgi:hypothetical protein